MSESPEGVAIQVYCALIAALLLAEHTGRRPNKRTYEIMTMYLAGWCTAEEATELFEKHAQKAEKKPEPLVRHLTRLQSGGYCRFAEPEKILICSTPLQPVPCLKRGSVVACRRNYRTEHYWVNYPCKIAATAGRPDSLQTRH